jgi:hypothetical protein
VTGAGSNNGIGAVLACGGMSYTTGTHIDVGGGL